MDGNEAAPNTVLAGDCKLEQETVVSESTINLSSIKVALVKPGGGGDDLPPEPQSRRQAMGSPEWEYWEAGER